MGVNSSTLWASTVPAMGIFDVPYVFNDYSAVGEAVNGEFGDKLRDAMEEKGAKVLMFADYGYVQFANNKRPLKSPADFKGLKIRSIGDLPSELFKHTAHLLYLWVAAKSIWPFNGTRLTVRHLVRQQCFNVNMTKLQSI